MNSREAFCYPDRHFNVDNTALGPEIVALRIAEHFALVRPADNGTEERTPL